MITLLTFLLYMTVYLFTRLINFHAVNLNTLLKTSNFDTDQVWFLLGYAIFQPLVGFFITKFGSAYAFFSLFGFGVTNLIIAVLAYFKQLSVLNFSLLRFLSGVFAAAAVLSYLGRLKKKFTEAYNSLSQIIVAMVIVTGTIISSIGKYFRFQCKVYSFYGIVGIISVIASLVFFVTEKENTDLNFQFYPIVKKFFSNKLSYYLILINFLGNLIGPALEATNSGNLALISNISGCLAGFLAGFLAIKFSTDFLIIGYGVSLLFITLIYRMGFNAIGVIGFGLLTAPLVNLTFNKVGDSFDVKEIVVAFGILNGFQMIGGSLGKFLYSIYPFSSTLIIFGVLAGLSILPFLMVKENE